MAKRRRKDESSSPAYENLQIARFICHHTARAFDFGIQLLFINIDKHVVGLLDRTIGFSFPGLGIILSLAALYLLKFIASNMVDKKIFSLIEEVTERLPFIKTTYQVGKQLADTLSLPEKQVFKRALLVDYLKPGIWTTGFETGRITDRRIKTKCFLRYAFPPLRIPLSGPWWW